jgi:hypothetical protein
MFFHAGWLTILSVSCYTASIVLARKTIKIMRCQGFQMSRKTFNLQKQFGRALFAQVGF